MTEFIEVKLPESYSYKYVYYFDKNGYIQKSETYMSIDNDEYELGSLTFYKRVDNSAFKLTSYDGYYENLSAIGNDTFIENTIHSEYKTNNFPLLITSTKKLDKKQRILEWINTNTNTETNEINYQTSKKFVYNNNRVSKVIVNNGKEKTTKTLLIKNEKLDRYGNFLYQEYFTEDSKLESISKREYVYW
ncbi:hypothetical protein [Tenacibaculum sp. MAR_2009_124]|uniref:hypothetical protein n=1 Tax=Tenacibaculum sp. MAR_2009_124 TaxID=1250059 RepID=UPI00115F822F|nr:hypothetical protein [Tenacibaculum sp. MAR_2009_124]